MVLSFTIKRRHHLATSTRRFNIATDYLEEKTFASQLRLSKKKKEGFLINLNVFLPFDVNFNLTHLSTPVEAGY